MAGQKGLIMNISSILASSFLNLVSDLWYIFALLIVANVIVFKIKMMRRALRYSNRGGRGGGGSSFDYEHDVPMRVRRSRRFKR